MLDKLKTGLSAIGTFFQSAGKYVVEIMAVVIGVLLYYINLKHKEIAGLQAQIDLVDTQRKADVLEAQIKEKLTDNTLLQKEVDGYNASLLLLQQKRKELAAAPDTRTPQQVQDYWNNDKP